MIAVPRWPVSIVTPALLPPVAVPSTSNRATARWYGDRSTLLARTAAPYRTWRASLVCPSNGSTTSPRGESRRLVAAVVPLGPVVARVHVAAAEVHRPVGDVHEVVDHPAAAGAGEQPLVEVAVAVLGRVGQLGQQDRPAVVRRPLRPALVAGRRRLVERVPVRVPTGPRVVTAVRADVALAGAIEHEHVVARRLVRTGAQVGLLDMSGGERDVAGDHRELADVRTGGRAEAGADGVHAQQAIRAARRVAHDQAVVRPALDVRHAHLVGAVDQPRRRGEPTGERRRPTGALRVVARDAPGAAVDHGEIETGVRSAEAAEQEDLIGQLGTCQIAGGVRRMRDEALPVTAGEAAQPAGGQRVQQQLVLPVAVDVTDDDVLVLVDR